MVTRENWSLEEDLTNGDVIKLDEFLADLDIFEIIKIALSLHFVFDNK